MDREKLKNWLSKPTKTWRWPLEETQTYQAVIATSHSLKWYTWSHQYEEGGEKPQNEQSLAHFIENGPFVSMPKSIENELKEWILEISQEFSSIPAH